MNIEEVFYKYHSELVGYADFFLKDEDEAKDVVQWTFIKFHKSKFKKIDEEKSVRAFLYNTLKNIIYNRQRDNAVMQRRLNEYYSWEEFEIVESTFEELYKAINCLPDRAKTVINMLRSGYSYNDIADELKITVNSVKTIRRFAISKLKKLLIDADSTRSYSLIILILKNYLKNESCCHNKHDGNNKILKKV